LMMSLWDALRMNMMISYQELVRTFPNQPATASQKTDEVANKTTPSMTVDTIFSGTGFTPLQWVAMEREHS
ncbi:hypothetical protein RZQ49_31300, partial [Klebsiella michiganensis]